MQFVRETFFGTQTGSVKARLGQVTSAMTTMQQVTLAGIYQLIMTKTIPESFRRGIDDNASDLLGLEEDQTNQATSVKIEWQAILDSFISCHKDVELVMMRQNTRISEF